jgi:predicted nuclease of predicted toxin-antitoxin system
MKFLIDVNASGILARWLSDHGHDVLLVEDVDPRMGDEKILEWARREKRILVTTDQDFEEMIWRENRQHEGVLRLENLPRMERLSLLEYVLNRHNKDLASKAIIIASKRKIRIRKTLSGGLI